MTVHSQQIQDSCFLKNEFGDSYLYEVNHNSLNKIGAEQLHQQRFKQLLSRKNSLIIIVGTDSGTLLPYLDQHAISPGTRIILVELPEVYDKIKTALPDFEKLLKNKNIFCVTYDDFNATQEEVDTKKYAYLGNIKLIQSRAAEDAFLPEYQELFYKLQTELQQLSWNIQASLGSEAFLEKQLKNLGENIRSAECLRESFKGKTAVLLAGGPSLDDILPWVLENRSNLVTIAVSRICRRLKEIDLEPDIIFSIDPNQVSFDISKDMLSFWQSSLFIHAYHVSPQLLGQWRGRNLYLGNRFPWETDLNEKTLPHPGPTVSNVALGVAVEMGFSQIVLAGVDLCFSQNGYTHAKGSNESKAGPQLGKVCAQVETNSGRLAESSSDFVTAIDILDTQAFEARERGVIFINPAPDAAKISNIEHWPLEDIVMSNLDKNPKKQLHDLIPKTTGEERRLYYKKVIRELAQAQGKFRQIKQLTIEALRCNDGLFGRNGRKRNFKHKKRMDKIERSLNKKHARFSTLVKGYGIRHFLSLTRLEKDADWDDKEIEETARKYYEAYKKSATSLILLVQKSKKRIESRLEEESDSPNISALTSQWRKDKQPGRALVWLTRRDMTIRDLSAPYQDEITNLEKEFRATLDNSETAHMKRSRQFADLTGIRAKTQMFFRQQNLEALKQLVQSLNNHPDTDAKKYLALTQGYIFELKGEPNKAMDQYQKILATTNEILLEEVLRRVASITIAVKDLKNGLLALESLAAISPSYLIQYGELLKLTGAHQDALNIFLNYLEKVPGDMTTMLNVGRYYRELNIEEGAQAMFQHVLHQDPHNALAKKLLQKAA